MTQNRYEHRSSSRKSTSGNRTTKTYQSGPTYSPTRNTKQDIYTRHGSGSGNHGHKVKTGNGFTTYSRPGPRGSSSMSLGEILFGPKPKKRR